MAGVSGEVQQVLVPDGQVGVAYRKGAFYRITDPQKAVEVARDVGQGLYREAQLILREAIGAKSLEALLEEKDALAGYASERLCSVSRSSPNGSPS